MPDGIVVIDKPEGWTSMDVCAKLRGVFHVKRVGHAGTLDPMATGVLPVFVGQATKAIPFAEEGHKTYEALLRPGLVTDTQDVMGTILSSDVAAAKALTRADIEAVLPRFRGGIEQIPPMYSAVKMGGKKLYELARKGVTVERKPRSVTIYSLELRERTEDGDWPLVIECSKGTYIRTICHDIGQALSCGACMSALRRTQAARFTLDEAVKLSDVEAQGAAVLRPLDSLFRQYPAYRIPNETIERRCRCGNPLRVRSLEPGVYRVYGCDGSFLALSRCENGTLTAIRNFFTT